MDDLLVAGDLTRLSEFVGQTLGLHFPPNRWPDLQRGMAATARELGFGDAAACARPLLGAAPAKEHLDALAGHLTVGETYFFRDHRSFEFLADHIVPALVRQKRGGEKRMRIWSAACCTGEEAYSIAITLHRTVPDLEDWNVTLLATDINLRFLRKAAAGVFGRWSFRDAPAGLQETYFRPVGEDRWEILPYIKRMVQFAPLNLVADPYPSVANQTNAIDVIFCRNVLMYFTVEQTRKVIANLHLAQVEGGWLLVGPGELSQLTSGPYQAVTAQAATHYRKLSEGAIPEISPSLAPLVEAPADIEPELTAASVCEAAAAPVVEIPAAAAPENPSRLGRMARRLANRGNLAAALDCCDRWIAADKLDPAAHYLRTMILQGQGATANAARSLQQALYLNPDFVIAHFALGNIARNGEKAGIAERHFKNTRRLLRRYEPEAILPESDGITAARFKEIIDSLLSMGVAA